MNYNNSYKKFQVQSEVSHAIKLFLNVFALYTRQKDYV